MVVDNVITNNGKSRLCQLYAPDTAELAYRTVSRAKNSEELRPSSIAVLANHVGSAIEDIVSLDSIVNDSITTIIADMEYCRVSILAEWLRRSKRCIRMYINGIMANPDRYGTDYVIHVGNRYEAAPMAVLDYYINWYALQYDEYSHLVLPYDPDRLRMRLRGVM